MSLKDTDPFIEIDGEKVYPGAFLYYGDQKVTFVGRSPNYFGHWTSAMFIPGHLSLGSTHMGNLDLAPPK